ncbi:MAG TPA: glycosyltransferase family 4 protein [Cytophagaceae bacterium]|nr:glycosyltransferase family 4 protein [Cytophagaceae bacterium]
MKILHISPRVPFPPTDGGAIGIYNIVTGAAKAGHEIHLLSVNTPKHRQPDNVVPHLAFQKSVFIDTSLSVMKALGNFFKNIPYNVDRFISNEFSKVLIEMLKRNNYDVVQIEGTYVAWYVDLVKKYAACPIIIRAHNIEYVIWERLAENCENPFKKNYLKFLAKRLKKFEAEYYKKFDGIAAITQEDVNRLRSMGVNNTTRTIPAGVNIENFKTSSISPKPFTIFILSSLDWLPNQEAVLWFLKNVWTELIKEIPQMELHIAGKNTPDSFYQLKGDSIIIHGFVNNSSEFMQQHDLMAVPLLSGGGMRVKIIEGMAQGKIIISSSVGAEGIHCEDGKNILIADSFEEWVSKIVAYFRQRQSYLQIGENARSLIAKEYSNEKVTSDYIEFYKELIAHRKR